MASRSLGTLTLDLIAKIGGFTAPLDKAGRDLDKRMRAMSKTAFAVGTAMGQFLHDGIVAAARAIPALVQGAINSADAMRDLSIRLGESTETLSAYGYAASQTGTDIETLGKGLKILSKNAADALNPTSEQAKIFDALGIKVTDAQGKLKGLSQLVPEIADRFKVLENGTTKAALAQALFGKAGLELTEFLNQGSAGLDDFAKKADELGIIIDTKTATAADDFNDTLGDLKAQASGLGLDIARELLPSLKDSATDLRELIKQGDLASDIAQVLGASFSAAAGILSGYAKSVQITSAAMEYMVKVGDAWLVIQKNMSTFGFADGTISGAIDDIKKATAEGDATLEQIHNPKKPQVKLNFAGEGPDPEGLFKSSTEEVALRKQIEEMEKRLALALSNPSAPKAVKAPKAGKSDAEKEAERLKEAYDRLIESQKEQIALFGQTSEASQVRYDTEFGDLKNLTQAQKDAAIANAERLDQMREEAEVQKDLDEVNKRREQSVAQMLDNLKNEAIALGLSNEQQEIFNNLKYAGVDALSAEGQEIIKWTENVQKARESRAIIDDLKDASKDFFVDLADGAGSAREAWDDFFDGIKRRALEFVADKVINQFFDMLSGKGSSSGGGSSGGGFWSAIAGFFGGGFGGEGSPLAGGGWTDPMKYHQVGEHDRPELLLKNGRQYLLPGDRGRVVPMTGGGGDFTFAPTFLLPQRMDSRTQQQISQRTGDAAREAMRRNSGR